MKTTDTPWEDLANGIILIAVDDYTEALRSQNDTKKIAIEKFFHPGWFSLLTEADPDFILDGLRRQGRIKKKGPRFKE